VLFLFLFWCCHQQDANVSVCYSYSPERIANDTVKPIPQTMTSLMSELTA
jgi:hypothetical protein